MNIIYRNLYILINAGAFNEKKMIEPMTNWKWKKVYEISQSQSISCIVYDGLKQYINDGVLTLPDELMEKWHNSISSLEQNSENINDKISKIFSQLMQQQLRPILLKGQSLANIYPNHLHRKCSTIKIYFAYEPQAEKADKWARENGKRIDDTEKHILAYMYDNVRIENHRLMEKMMNRHLNKQFQRIINGEIRCCDSSYTYINDVKIETIPPTLNLLIIITDIAHRIINEGIRLKRIVDLGLFLRKNGDKVDFVKLQLWIESLRIQRMANLEGLMLIKMFGFMKEEIPFVISRDDKILNRIINDTYNNIQHTSISVGDTLRRESRSIFYLVYRSRRFFSCYPSEINSTMLTKIAHSLDQIEE
jgi:hypothetical protein